MKNHRKVCNVWMYQRAKRTLSSFNLSNPMMLSSKKHFLVMWLKALSRWKPQLTDLSQAEKIENIRKDILNAPHHVFGEHLKCSNYFCDKETHKNDVNCIPEMKKSGMYNNIMHALARLLENAKSLLYNLNTNFPEQFNSVIAKHLGGKRVNFCTGLSYEGRVDCSSISFNTGRLVSHMKKFLSGNIELNKQTLIYKIESGRLKRRETTAKPGYLRKVKVFITKFISFQFINSYLSRLSIPVLISITAQTLVSDQTWVQKFLKCSRMYILLV